jgi:hypothetical protein
LRRRRAKNSPELARDGGLGATVHHSQHRLDRERGGRRRAHQGVVGGGGTLSVFWTGNLLRVVPEVDECGLAEIGNSKEDTRGTQFRHVRAARCVIPYVLCSAWL